MEVEEVGQQDKIQFNFVLVSGDVLVFSGALLKYVGLFNAAYSSKYASYKEHVDFQLDYGLWRLVLAYLAEYDRGLATKNSWSQALMGLELLRLYEMARILDYYDVSVLIDVVLQIIVSHWMGMPRTSLRGLHPKAIFPSPTLAALVTRQPLEAINITYALRREDALAICRAYIKTHELVQIVDQQFLPHTTSFLHRHECSSDDVWSLMLTSRGLFARGAGGHGQMGLGLVGKNHANWRGSVGGQDVSELHDQYLEELPEWTPVKLPPNVEVISLACGSFHTILLTTDGLYGCGSNEYGQLGSSMDVAKATALRIDRDGNEYMKLDFLLPTQLNVQNVLLVACGADHTMVYTRKGLFACGANEAKQLGVECAVERDSVDTFMRVAFDEEVAAISCGDTYSIILSKRGDAYLIGTMYWQPTVVYALPHKLETPTPIVAIATTTSASRILLLGKDGGVYLLSKDHEDYPNIHATPTKIDGLPPIISIATSESTSFFIDAQGGVYTISMHPFFAKREERADINTAPTKLSLNQPVISIKAGDEFTYFLTCDGLYVYEDYQLSKVPLHLTDTSLCKPSIAVIQQQRRMGCHQCGEQSHALLGCHKATQRVFCSTRGCLAEYKQFRVL